MGLSFSIDRYKMNSSYVSTSTSNTRILDLNDDCLLDVFKHLDLIDLVATADVCRRFRQNAQAHFASSKFKDDILRIVFNDRYKKSYGFLYLLQARHVNTAVESRTIRFQNDLLHHKLLCISKVLRNFGASVKSIRIIGKRNISAGTEIESKYMKPVFELMLLYCSGTLIELYLDECRIPVDIEWRMHPLLLHLKKLKLCDCAYSGLFALMLSTWSPELLTLQFTNLDDQFEIQFREILSKSYPKMELLSFDRIHNVTNYDISKFLQRNPQLKKIEIGNCRSIDEIVFRSIVVNVPNIEAIGVDRVYTRADSNLKFVGKLSCLNTLRLCDFDEDLPKSNFYIVDKKFMPSILYEIHAAARRYLLVIRHGPNNFPTTGPLVESISTLKTLKIWRFSFEIEYVQMKQMVRHRQDGTRLVIKLNHNNHIAASIPEHIIQTYNDVLTLAVEDRTQIRKTFFFIDIDHSQIIDRYWSDPWSL